VVDSQSNIIGTQGIMFDITERKLAEEARKESYEFNKSLLKTIPFGMNIVDEYGNILFQSENFENVFSKKAIGGKCWEFYRDDKSQCIDCPLHKGIEIGQTASYESEGVLGGRIFEISHTGMIFKGKKAMLEIFQDITERKLAEEEMKRAKKLLEQTFEQSPVPMVLVSMPDMMIRIVNPACRSFLGIDDEASVINTSLKEINPTWQDYDVNGKQTDFEDIPLPKSLMGKQTIGEERQIVRKDGTIRYNLASAFPIYNDQNKIIAGTLFMSDITDMKQAQKEALESVKLFRDLFNASPDAILLIDTNHPTISWPIVDCNEAACRMNGYTREEMIGQPIDLLHTNITTQEEHDAYFNNLKEEGILCRENVHRHKDGHRFPIETSNTIVVIGGHQMLLGIDRDITDRKQTEVELLEKNTFIQTILDNLPIGLALNSIDNGSALYMNKKFEEIYGWPLTEVKDVSDFFYNVYPDENYRSELISTIMTDIQSGDTQRMHWENIIVTRKDGSKRVINAVNIPLVEQNTMVSTVSDITELHKSQNDLVAAKEKAEESDRLKSAFLANMSHEIRTPLNSIIGFSDLLFDPDFDEEQKKTFAENISSSGNGLLAIITDIMDLSKIETGQVKFHKSKFSINRVVSDIHREYVFQASKKGIELLIDPLNPEDIFIESDEDKLRQVLINFVTNALKFTESGFIEMGVRDQGDCVYLQVKDTGIGIPEEYHDKVFERFRQVESANSRKYGGNGLGLAISKSLVEMLGGKIGIESVQGKGSTFYFTIPK
jgi:PAS domain S-box-containing protein